MTDEAGRLLQELLYYAKYCEMIAAERAATTGRLEPSDAWWGEVGVTLRGVSDLLLTQQRALAEGLARDRTWMLIAADALVTVASEHTGPHLDHGTDGDCALCEAVADELEALLRGTVLVP